MHVMFYLCACTVQCCVSLLEQVPGRPACHLPPVIVSTFGMHDMSKVVMHAACSAACRCCAISRWCICWLPPCARAWRPRAASAARSPRCPRMCSNRHPRATQGVHTSRTHPHPDLLLVSRSFIVSLKSMLFSTGANDVGYHWDKRNVLLCSPIFAAKEHGYSRMVVCD